jgi:hypothetical protein
LPPETALLLQLRLRAGAGLAELARLLGEQEAVVEDRVTELESASAIARRGRHPVTWQLTAEGRRMLAAGLQVELGESGAADAVDRAYAAFLDLNQTLLGLCTAWQVRPAGDTPSINDHADLDYDRRVIAELEQVHEGVMSICEGLAAALDRFGGYGPRFALALTRVQHGDPAWFDSPSVDSYHSVWFELHENLLATLGLERSQEPPP